MYNVSEITTLDLLEALDLASIRIFKFGLGSFDKEYKFQIFADEYLDGKLVNTDTLLDHTNVYGFFIEEDYFPGFIDQLKIFTKTEENQSELRLNTYAFSIKKEVSLNINDERQFFIWREYKDATWKLNQKVPLLVFASSWLDKKYDFHRFCGVVKLAENEKDTKELLKSSPNYITISYKVSEKSE
jgi:hypothetical protein